MKKMKVVNIYKVGTIFDREPSSKILKEALVGRFPKREQILFQIEQNLFQKPKKIPLSSNLDNLAVNGVKWSFVALCALGLLRPHIV